MKIKLQILNLHLKSVGIYALIPFAVLFVLLPFLNYMDYRQYGVSFDLYASIIGAAEWFIPAPLSLPALFVMRGYVEDDGNELLFIGKRRSKLTDMLIVFIFYFFFVFILFCGYAFVFPYIFIDLIYIFFDSFLFAGFSYFLMFLSSSSVLTAAAEMMYALMSIIPVINSPVFYIPREFSVQWNGVITRLPFFLCGALFFLFGFILNKYRVKYR